MAISARENWRRTSKFRYSEWIPCYVGLAPILFKLYPQDLEHLVSEHPRIFPGYIPGKRDDDWMPPAYYLGERYRDNCECVWLNIQEGIEGQVIESPLASWSALASWQPPDTRRFFERKEADWESITAVLRKNRRLGKLASGNGERLFDWSYALRGFENLMLDFALETPEMQQPVDILTEHELHLLALWINAGVDVIAFHTDISSQRGLMISPASFRKYIKPRFMTLLQRCRQAGEHVNLSSDGRLLETVDDLLECGVSMYDPQLRANGLGIQWAYCGRLCVNSDLDRQGFPFMTPAEMRDQVREIIDALAPPEGGLMLLAQFYGNDISLPVIAACLEPMEDYCFVK